MLYGADISAFQDGFDFTANRQDAMYVILKQTEGLTWPEQNAESEASIRRMRQEAQAAEYVWVGLYHFARPSKNRTGRQEAEHFISFVGELAPNEGVCLDYEANNGLSGEELEDFAIDFVNTIEERWPTLRGNILFYCYPDFLANMSTDRLVTRCPLWVAAYGANNGRENAGALDLDRWQTYCFWQFTSNGHMPGWDGQLDINRFDGDDISLRKLGSGNTETIVIVPPPPVIVQPEFVPEAWHGEYLRRGNSGIRVLQIQQRLKRRGWQIGLDSNFGRETDTVVKKFQAEKGLRADGIVGQSTWDTLYAFFEGVDVMPDPIVVPPPLPPVPDPGEGALHVDPVGWCTGMGFDGNAGLNPVVEFQRAFAWWALVVDGVAGPKTAAAVQVVVDNGDRLSEHFTIDELKCKHCGRIRFLRETLESLELIRAEVGPLSPISAYRCPTHNANVGGATTSQHMMGAASDLNIPLTLAERVRLSGIGVCGDDCLHGDCRHASGNNTTGGTPGNATYWSYC